MSRGLDRPCRLHRLLYRNLHLRLFLLLIDIFFLIIDVPVLFAHRIILLRKVSVVLIVIVDRIILILPGFIVFIRVLVFILTGIFLIIL